VEERRLLLSDSLVLGGRAGATPCLRVARARCLSISNERIGEPKRPINTVDEVWMQAKGHTYNMNKRAATNVDLS